MTHQLAIDFTSPRAEGERLGALCADRASRVADFDVAGARSFVLIQLVRHGDMSGEALTDAAVAHGFRPHDQRAYGAVFGGLVRKNLIHCVGYCERKKGHGTAGGRIWSLVK